MYSNPTISTAWSGQGSLLAPCSFWEKKKVICQSVESVESYRFVALLTCFIMLRNTADSLTHKT